MMFILCQGIFSLLTGFWTCTEQLDWVKPAAGEVRLVLVSLNMLKASDHYSTFWS